MDNQNDQELVPARLSATPSVSAVEADAVKSTAANTPICIRSSPPALPQSEPMDLDLPNCPIEDFGVKSDSEAETIVLARKDDHSSPKVRKSIKHEDKSEDERMRIGVEAEDSDALIDVDLWKLDKPGEVATSMLGKRKRSRHGNNVKDDPSHAGNSSGLSSVPTSPVATARSSVSKPAASDSDISKSPSPRTNNRDKAKSVDRVLSRRKAHGQESEEESDLRRVSRQRSPGAEHKQSKEHRTLSKLNVEADSRNRTRSISPPSRGHKRSTSTQLTSGATNGLGHKKKRVPAPLQSTEYHSDDSSASGSPHPRSSRLRNLAAPATGDSSMSSAKLASHKKHLDAHGQTLLARACSAGRLEPARQRLAARPEDLNYPDYAGNTPLQVASLEGHSEIVKLLLDAGCNLDCVNNVKDTPLLDAVDNGHLEVVKLLLDAGVNPRKGNVSGEEPLDRAKDDMDNAVEIREAIIAAKLRSSEIRRPSEDDVVHDTNDSRLSHPTESPRHTPPVQTPESQALSSTSRRGASGRSTKTSNHLLYMPMTEKTLRTAAGKGDLETVIRILQVKDGCDDPESLIAAAKGGHDNVINLLLGLGSFNPDPPPLDSMPSDHATPILAAIGRENIEVIKLLVNQTNFDPTRIIEGETYYEIAKRRAGTFWKEEEAILRDKFENYKKNPKYSPSSARSPGLRRDADRENRRAVRDDAPLAARSHRRNLSSPRVKEAEARKKENSGQSPDSNRGQHRSSSSISQSKDTQSQTKRGPGRPRKVERTSSSAISDRETTPLGPPKQKAHPKRSESDVAAASSENETIKPRRKLVSGKDLRGEREKQRRASFASTTSNNSVKERHGASEIKLDPSVIRTTVPRLLGSASEPELTSEGSLHDRARSLKRDDSKDRVTAIRTESPVKRRRTSVTPPRSGMQELMAGLIDDSEGPSKRRRLEDPKHGRRVESTFSSSPDHYTGPGKSGLSHETKSAKISSGASELALHAARKKSDSSEKFHMSKTVSGESATSQTAKISKNPVNSNPDSLTKPDNYVSGDVDGDVDEDVAMDDAVPDTIKSDEDLEGQIRRENAEKELKMKREAEERFEQERIEQAKQARLAREKLAREEEAKRQQEEAERRERQRQEDAEAHHRAEEERRRLYLEQQRLQREDQERRRAAREAEQRAERLRVTQQQEKERLAKLPYLLRWFDQCPNVRSPEITSLFRYMEGIRYDTIRPEAAGTHNAREQWLLNTDVALLLGEKDLQLSRYTAWERISVSEDAKKFIWNLEKGKYTLADSRFSDMRAGVLPEGQPLYMLSTESMPLWIAMDLFFVKVSEFMFIVPNFPHLRGIEMVVKYRELEPYGMWPQNPGKYTQDPDRHPSSFYPQPMLYMNGELIGQAEQRRSKTSKTPFPENRLPRRGLVIVQPHEPDYEEKCRAQGLHHLLPGHKPSMSNPSMSPRNTILGTEQINGITPPSSDRSLNGGSPRQGAHSILAVRKSPCLPNGNSKSLKESGGKGNSSMGSL